MVSKGPIGRLIRDRNCQSIFRIGEWSSFQPVERLNLDKLRNVDAANGTLHVQVTSAFAQKQREVTSNRRELWNGFDDTPFVRCQHHFHVYFGNVDTIPKFVLLRIIRMQLTKYGKVSIAERPTRMVVRRNRIRTRFQLNIKPLQDGFDIAFQIEKIEFTLRFMHRLGSLDARSSQNQRAVFAAMAINFSEFV